MVRIVSWIAVGLMAIVARGDAAAEGPSAAALPQASVIVVRPPGWGDALRSWIEYRSPQYRIVEIDSRTNAIEQHSAILEAASRCRPAASAILLCGDVVREIPAGEAVPRGVPLAGAPRRGKGRLEILTPSMVFDTSIRLGAITTPELCTDALFGDLDGDGCPDLAVGRLPAKTPDELQRMLARSRVYESAAPGPWNDTIHVTAGVGGFGLIADTAIETVTRRFLTEGIPDHFRLQMTYASCTSSYCPNPTQFRESYIERINGGGLFWVYVGHGSVTHLDYMQAGNQWLPLGESEDADRFRIHSRPPIAVMLACFTGAFDANVDCFAERLLAQDAGPIAVIAGSRVTMPYGLSQLASEMINGCFRDRIPTLGDIVLQAKRRIWHDDTAVDSESTATFQDALGPSAARIDIRQRYRKIVTDMAMALSPGDHDLLEERREHVRLMNLLGDPLLKIPHPDALPLNLPTLAAPGSEIQVQGHAPFAGPLTVELALVRDRLPSGIVPLAAYEGTPTQHDQMQSNYESSNQLIAVRSEQMVAPGEFAVRIQIPEDLKGRCIVSAYLYGETAWAVGSQRIAIRNSK